MDEKTIKRLQVLAPNLQEFFELEESEREWVHPLLSKSIRSTIELLETIEEESKTYEEISETVGLHLNTVKQKLLALKRGGFPIMMAESAAILETGRKRVLSKKINPELVKLVKMGDQ